MMQYIHFLNNLYFKWKILQFQLSGSIKGVNNLYVQVFHTDDLEEEINHL